MLSFVDDKSVRVRYFVRKEVVRLSAEREKCFDDS